MQSTRLQLGNFNDIYINIVTLADIINNGIDNI